MPRRESQLASLERSVLPLFSARLPPGAEALGVGASLDGTFMRMFVRLSDTKCKAEPENDATAAAAAAASAALGALLGCEVELLAGSGPIDRALFEEPIKTESAKTKPALTDIHQEVGAMRKTKKHKKQKSGKGKPKTKKSKKQSKSSQKKTEQQKDGKDKSDHKAKKRVRSTSS